MSDPAMPFTTHTLLIWEEIPETRKLYLVPNDILDETDYAIFRLAHGKFINFDHYSKPENDALDCLNHAFCPDVGCLSDNHPPGSKWAMRFKDYLLEAANPVEGLYDKPITHVYLSGFVL